MNATELNSRISCGAVFVRVTRAGLPRVLEGWEGMTLQVEKFTEGQRGPVAHCIDRRYPNEHRDYQIWSIAADGYEVQP